MINLLCSIAVCRPEGTWTEITECRHACCIEWIEGGEGITAFGTSFVRAYDSARYTGGPCSKRFKYLYLILQYLCASFPSVDCACTYRAARSFVLDRGAQ